MKAYERLWKHIAHPLICQGQALNNTFVTRLAAQDSHQIRAQILHGHGDGPWQRFSHGCPVTWAETALRKTGQFLADLLKPQTSDNIYSLGDSPIMAD